MTYLKNEQYYSDLYDLNTIKQCLDFEQISVDVPNPPPIAKGKSISKENAIKLVQDISIYCLTGERFKNRSETINEWMAKDREKDQIIENATEPTGIYCDFCSARMNMTMRDMFYDDSRVMFWFECPRCNKRKIVFENGEVYEFKPKYCPKCSSELTETHKRVGKVITTNINCSNCEYKSKEVMDLEKDQKQWDEKERLNRELLRKYKAKYCMSEKDGLEYIQHAAAMNRFAEVVQEQDRKAKDPAYQKAKLLQTISATELEKLLTESLKNDNYTKLIFDKPEIDRYVMIPFTVRDNDSTRKDYESRTKLQKVIKGVLEKTNWRLMSEGIGYRLGYLSGRLKGYEQEEDLSKLFRKTEA